MKTIQLLLLTLTAMCLLSCSDSNSENTETTSTPDREYYQLKIYTFDTDAQINLTDQYLADAYLPALKRQGIQPVGVFKRRRTETDTLRQTYVLIPFDDLETFASVEDKLIEDSTYLAAASAYLGASHNQPPYQRIESSLMRAFTDMPVLEPTPLDGPRAERVYELRSYESSNEQYYRSKVDMFNAGGEVKLFDRLGFNAVFYAEVLSGAHMPNLLYMTTFADQASRDSLWPAFFEAPEWKEMKAQSKYDNNVSHADILFLYPTAYSDY